MWELNHKESWMLKNWCFWTVVLEKTLESPWTTRRPNQSILKEISPDAEAEAPILWPPNSKNRLIGKDPVAEKDWRQEKGMTEDEMARWHHQLDGYEFEQVPGVGDGQRSLGCCSPWGRKESDSTEQLNWISFKCAAKWSSDYIHTTYIYILFQILFHFRLFKDTEYSSLLYSRFLFTYFIYSVNMLIPGSFSLFS